MKDEVSASMEKVQELRALSEWSDGHFWVSPEQHGNVTGVFKTQSENKGISIFSLIRLLTSDRQSIGFH